MDENVDLLKYVRSSGGGSALIPRNSGCRNGAETTVTHICSSSSAMAAPRYHFRRLFISFARIIMDKAQQLLVEKFRLTSFRGHQEAVIRRLLEENKNALAIMPTGASAEPG